MNDFQTEWAILHNNIEKYERFSLIIKLFTLLISSLSITINMNEYVVIFLILILWLQDGIWKTFQARLEKRILLIEQIIKNKATDNETAYQLYSQWEENRPSVINLIKAYLFTSLKPTVAYPYAPLILLIFIIYQSPIFRIT